jgi:hypothetical protein
VEDVAVDPETPCATEIMIPTPSPPNPSRASGCCGEVRRMQEHSDQVAAQARACRRRGALEREQELFWQQK